MRSALLAALLLPSAAAAFFDDPGFSTRCEVVDNACLWTGYHASAVCVVDTPTADCDAVATAAEAVCSADVPCVRARPCFDEGWAQFAACDDAAETDWLACAAPCDTAACWDACNATWQTAVDACAAERDAAFEVHCFAPLDCLADCHAVPCADQESIACKAQKAECLRTCAGLEDASQACDLSGPAPITGFDGTSTVDQLGAAATTGVVGSGSGVHGDAFTFDGAAQGLDIAWAGRDTYSYSAYVYIDSAGPWQQTLISQVAGPGAPALHACHRLWFHGPQSQVYFTSDGPGFSLGAPVTPDTWVHLVATNDPATNTAVLYVDGVEAARGSARTCFTQYQDRLLLGQAPYVYVPAPLQGALDEVQLFDRVLDAAEAASLATTPICR